MYFYGRSNFTDTGGSGVFKVYGSFSLFLFSKEFKRMEGGELLYRLLTWAVEW